MYKYLLKGIKRNGGQKNGILAPGCKGGGGGGGVKAEVEAEVDVEVEEVADWDVVDVDVPLPVMPWADEDPPTEPESKKNHL